MKSVITLPISKSGLYLFKLGNYLEFSAAFIDNHNVQIIKKMVVWMAITSYNSALHCTVTILITYPAACPPTSAAPHLLKCTELEQSCYRLCSCTRSASQAGQYICTVMSGREGFIWKGLK